MFYVQVLSGSVAKTLAMQNDPQTLETRRFVATFNRFFDLLNVRSLTEASHERNPDKEPYRSPSDERLKVILCCEIVNINVNIPVWCFNFFLILVARK